MFNLYHTDAPINDNNAADCLQCFEKFMQIMKESAPAPAERNYAMFCRRHDATGKILEEWHTIGPDFGVSSCTVRHVVRAMWRRLGAYHLRKCLGISFAMLARKEKPAE